MHDTRTTRTLTQGTVTRTVVIEETPIRFTAYFVDGARVTGTGATLREALLDLLRETGE